jgi:hypothetical protein
MIPMAWNINGTAVKYDVEGQESDTIPSRAGTDMTEVQLNPMAAVKLTGHR